LAAGEDALTGLMRPPRHDSGSEPSPHAAERAIDLPTYVVLSVASMKERPQSDPWSWFFQAALRGVTEKAVDEAGKTDDQVGRSGKVLESVPILWTAFGELWMLDLRTSTRLTEPLIQTGLSRRTAGGRNVYFKP
jgi:hypothetical protein